MIKPFVLKTIRLYQKTAPGRKVLLGSLIPVYSSCRFSPTCSEYTYQAVSRYGVLKGLFLGTKRILSCNPWGETGYKPLT
ncbi:MAG: membrane protein insertion efficiency factor YidD [Candidatus Levyibacteriota bacterium]